MQGSWLIVIAVLGLVGGLSAGTVRAADHSAAESTGAELTGAELSEMEQLLAKLNFDPGAVDGKVDDRTRTAIRLYQEFAILPVNGEPSAKLLRELRQVSQVYAEMRAALPEPESEPEPEPEPAVTPPVEPEPAAEVAVAEPPPEAAPEIPEPPAKTGLVEEVAEPEPEPEAAAPMAPAPGSEEIIAAPAEAEPAAELAVAEPAPASDSEPQVAKLQVTEPTAPAPEPEAAAAIPTEAEPVVELAVAEPEPEVAAPVEPEPEPAVAGPVLDAEPTAVEPQVAEAKVAAPEPEHAATTPARLPSEDAHKTVPNATAPPTPLARPKAAPKGDAQFSIAGMITRLKERDHAKAPAVSTQAALTSPTDKAGRERTLIWKVQQELRRIGLDPGAVDGNLRTRTTGAIATYQRARGLTADGQASEELLARLEAEAAPRPQSETTALASVSPQAAAIDTAPNNGYQAFRAGYSAAQAGDFGAAVKLYDQAIDGGDLALEHLAAALYNRANAYQYLGAMDKAIKDYSAAIANKPGFPAAYYNRGFAFDTKGEQARAVEDFRKARDLGLQRLGVRSPDLPPPLL